MKGTLPPLRCYLGIRSPALRRRISNVLSRLGASGVELSQGSDDTSSVSASLLSTLSHVDAAVIEVTEKDSLTGVFEIGIAIGLGRPVLLAISPHISLPLALQELKGFTVAVSDEALEFQLQSFIDASTTRTIRRTGSPIRPSSDRVRTVPSSGAADEVQVASLLRTAGADVVEGAPSGRRSKEHPTLTSTRARPDLAAWFPGLQPPFNPVFVEVIGGRSTSPASKIYHRLGLIRQSNASALAMVVLTGPVTREDITQLSQDWPDVLVLTLEDLTVAVNRGALASMLVAIRNGIVHRE